MTINAALMSVYFLTPKASICTNMAQMQPASGRTEKAALSQVMTAN